MAKFRLAIKDRGGGRGLFGAKFADTYGAACSIQDSSSAMEPGLWLGCDEGMHHFAGECLARMHLSQEMAAALVPLLQHFVKHGRLPRPGKRKTRRAAP